MTKILTYFKKSDSFKENNQREKSDSFEEKNTDKKMKSLV